MAIDHSSSSFYSPWPDRLRHSAIILLAAGLALMVLVVFGELSPVRAAAVFTCIGAAALVPWRLQDGGGPREDGPGGEPGGGAAGHALAARLPGPPGLLH